MRVARLYMLLFAAIAAAFFVGNASGRAGAVRVAQSLRMETSVELSRLDFCKCCGNERRATSSLEDYDQ